MWVCVSVRESEKVDLAKVSRSDRVVCLFAKFLLMLMSATSKTKKNPAPNYFFRIIFAVKSLSGGSHFRILIFTADTFFVLSNNLISFANKHQN